MSVVVITGVSRGLGHEMAKEFAAAGHIVGGGGRSPKELRVLQDLLGSEHDFQTVSVSEDSQVESWAQSILDKYGPPDILINNAAVINSNAPLWEIAADEFQRVVDVNIAGIASTIRHFVPAMVARRSGTIVNFSSGWGRSVSAKVAPYCASKWAVEGLTQALALELPDGMAAVPLNPGVINTDMLQSCFGSGADGYPRAARWATIAVPYILALSADDNGQPLSVPGF